MKQALLLILISAYLISCKQNEVVEEKDNSANTSYEYYMDHHIHIQSDSAAKLVAELKLMFGMTDSLYDERATSAKDIIQILDSAKIEKGAIVSAAYMFGIPDLEIKDEQQKVEAENNYLRDQVVDSPRLKGFCSINPLTDYALDEVRRCFEELNLDGLKLHAANSGIDYFDSTHVAKLSDLFDLMNEYDKPMLIHMRNRNPEYGSEDVKKVIEELLIPHPDQQIVFAHMAGWGGYDTATHHALNTFIPYFEEGKLSKDNIKFGLGAVVYDSPEMPFDSLKVRMLLEDIAKVGPSNVVFASDWNYGVPSPGSYATTFKDVTSIDSVSWNAIRYNQGF